MCARHGAKVKRCSIDGCKNYAKLKEERIRHGAKFKTKRCSIDGYTNNVQRRGVCKRHGAYRKPYDESTAISLSHT